MALSVRLSTFRYVLRFLHANWTIQNLLLALDLCRDTSVKHIYRHPSVVKIELTGFNVIGTLMEDFTDAVLNPGTPYNKKLLSLVPEQFKATSDDTYTKLQSVIDFISNMTDLYAVQLYKDLRGID